MLWFNCHMHMVRFEFSSQSDMNRRFCVDPTVLHSVSIYSSFYICQKLSLIFWRNEVPPKYLLFVSVELMQAKIGKQFNLKGTLTYLQNGVSESIVHVIKHANFQIYRLHPDEVIQKNCKFTTNL